MKLSEGVEWGLHCTVLLAYAAGGRAAVSRRALADHYGLPEAYLAKHLRGLVAAGILHATSGPKGGYQLGKPAEQITVVDVVDAVEGTASPFTCQEIRQQGTGAVPPEQCKRPCGIAAVMAQAHRAWRESLRGVTVADLAERVPRAIREQNRIKFGVAPQGKEPASSPVSVRAGKARSSPRSPADAGG